ncbi:MAG: CBS domain-containing protein [archaeon]
MKLGSLRVQDLMTKPLVASPLDTASKVIELMKKTDTYEAFVPEQSRVATVTIRELLRTRDPEMRIFTLAFHVPLLKSDTDVTEASRLMTEHRIRALPIGENGEVSGQVSAISICEKILQQADLKLRVAQVMTPHPVTIENSDKIAKARDLMIRKEIDHLPVVSGGKLVGILTSSDIVYAMPSEKSPRKQSRTPEITRRLDAQVGGLMHKDPETCSPDDDALSILRRFFEGHKTYSIVMRWGELQGIVTIRDFMKILVPTRTMTIPTYIVGLPKDPFEAEAARTKFEGAVQRIRRTYPDLLEARAVVKQSRSSGERKRYEVEVRLNTPKESVAYSEEGWDLPAVFDILSNRLKRLTVKKPAPRRRYTRQRRGKK